MNQQEHDELMKRCADADTFLTYYADEVKNWRRSTSLIGELPGFIREGMKFLNEVRDAQAAHESRIPQHAAKEAEALQHQRDAQEVERAAKERSVAAKRQAQLDEEKAAAKRQELAALEAEVKEARTVLARAEKARQLLGTIAD